MGATDMANNTVIPINTGGRRSKRRRIVVQAVKGASGINFEVQLTPDAEAMSPEASSETAETRGVAADSGFRGCKETEDHKRTYWIGSDSRVGVLAAGAAAPDQVGLSFCSMEELETSTRDWRMPQWVSVWNQLPGARPVTRFENRRIAVERLWRAMQMLQEDVPGRQPLQTDKVQRAGPSKSKRILDLLQAPEGATLAALMEATGWQAHSVRGFLSGKLSKRLGLRFDSFRRDGERVYALRAAPTCELPNDTCS